MKNNKVMFLIVMHTFAENLDIPCIVTKTRKEAKKWIDEEMKDKKYNGGGTHQIKEIPLYENQNNDNTNLQFIIKMINRKYPKTKFQFKQQEDFLVLLHNNKEMEDNHCFMNNIIDIVYYALPKELANNLSIEYDDFNEMR